MVISPTAGATVLGGMSMFPVDPELPGLNDAVDPAVMSAVFSRLLSTQTHGELRLDGCTVSRLRYRRSERAVIQYELLVKAGQYDAPVRMWAAGNLYRGRKAKSVYSETMAGLPQRAMATAKANPTYALVPELGMFVQFFPHDRHMPGISVILEGGDKGLVDLLKRQAGHASGATSSITYEAMRYRPGVAATIRTSLSGESCAGSPAEPFVSYAKLTREAAVDSALAHWQRLGEAARRSGRFGIADAIGVSSTTGALVIARARGQSLEELLRTDTPVAPLALRCSDALRSLHMVDATFERRRAERSETQLRKATRFIGLVCPELAARLDRIAPAILSRLDQTTECLTHLDLKADHMFLDGDHVSFIDLDSSAMSDPVLDPAQLIARLNVMPLLEPVSRTRINEFRDHFLTSYFAAVPAGWADRYAPAYGLASLKVALFFVQHVMPDWRARVADIVTDIEQHLELPTPSL